MARSGQRNRGNQASVNGLVEFVPDVRRRPAFIARETSAVLAGLRTANGKRAQGQKEAQVFASHCYTVARKFLRSWGDWTGKTMRSTTSRGREGGQPRPFMPNCSYSRRAWLVRNNRRSSNGSNTHHTTSGQVRESTRTQFVGLSQIP